MPETNRIEYKQELTDRLEKEAVAFLNYREGGIIYIGINENDKVVGVEDPDGDMLKIKDRLKHNVRPSCMGLFDVAGEEHDGKHIVKITLASGPEKPYYLKKYGMSEKGCYIRVGTAAEPMPVKMIEELFSKRTRNSIGKIASPRQDLTFEQLKIYYEAAGTTLNDQFATNLELKTKDNQFNYAGYLLHNNISIKVAKYRDEGRSELTENNEYGQGSLIRATKQVLDKIELENSTATKITPQERKDKQRWDSIALREAVINAFVHNDYTKEVPPKFEIFSDRIEITSAGGLPEGLSKAEFFEGFSVPRNKELMRVFRDLGLVEQLGSGVPRILDVYAKDCFSFSNNFLRMVFPATKTPPQVTPQDIPQVTPQVERLVAVLNETMSRQELQTKLNLSDRKNFINNYIEPALKADVIEYTIPDKPNSKHQKYRLSKNIPIATPQESPQETPQVTPQVERLVATLDEAMSRKELQNSLGLSDRKSFINNYISPAIEAGFIEYTIPEKPNSSHQKYKLTESGKTYKKTFDK